MSGARPLGPRPGAIELHAPPTLHYNGGVDISSPAGGTDLTVTGLLHALRGGDHEALHALFPLLYDELRAVAHSHRRGWQGDLTLDTTALVHETYLKLAEQKRVSADSRAHFLAIASKAMRHILCNYATSKRRRKRGGDVEHVTYETGDGAGVPPLIPLSDDQRDLLDALDEALRKLERLDTRQSDIVECRFFGGMSIEDTAIALATSPATVKRQWTLARAWLYREMRVGLGGGGGADK